MSMPPVQPQPPAPQPVPAPSPAPAGPPAPDDDWLKNYQPAKPGNSKQKVLVIAAIAGMVLGVILLALTMLTGGDSAEAQLRQATARQQEVLRITKIATDTDNATSTSYDLAATVSSVGNSNLQQLTSITGAPKPEELIAGTETTTKLETAAQTNTFDEVFPAIIKQELTELNRQLSTVFEQTKNQQLQTTLSQIYDGNAELIKNIK